MSSAGRGRRLAAVLCPCLLLVCQHGQVGNPTPATTGSQSRPGNQEEAMTDSTSTGPARVAGMVGLDEAQEIADRMRRLAGSIARQQAQFLRLLDEIDRSEAWTHWIGVRTLVQWVS